MNPNEELSMLGYEAKYQYTQYSQDHGINVIPENDFRKLIIRASNEISAVLRQTYGPYGSHVMIDSMVGDTVSTKDGNKTFNALKLSNKYLRVGHKLIKKITDRVNMLVGDGTTSCVLLANEMIPIIEKAMTNNDKRHLKEMLDHIEADLQNGDYLQNDIEKHNVRKLTKHTIRNIIRVAANYDDTITDALIKALNPEYDESDDSVTALNNVVVESRPTYDGDTTVSYSIKELPGDYRICFKSVDETMSNLPHTTYTCLVYDHAFTTTDWNKLICNTQIHHANDKDMIDIIIFSRMFTPEFIDKTWFTYRQRYNITNPHIHLCQVQGENVKDEINDLCAILGSKAITVESRAFEPDELDAYPIVELSIEGNNCMCFYANREGKSEGKTLVTPTEYINTITDMFNQNIKDSYIAKTKFNERVAALSMNARNAILTVTSGSVAELNNIIDKIDDCVSIVESAFKFGVVPNMFVYGYNRIKEIMNDTTNEDYYALLESISNSIKRLYTIIWETKYCVGFLSPEKEEFQVQQERFLKYGYQVYDNPDKRLEYSFDIINEECVAWSQMPTSAQYDIEVISSAIAIIKQILTANMYVFDQDMLDNTGDSVSYSRIGE